MSAFTCVTCGDPVTPANSLAQKLMEQGGKMPMCQVDFPPIDAIIDLATQTIAGRFLFLNADANQQNICWVNRPALVDIRPVVCVAASATSAGRFAFRGEIT